MKKLSYLALPIVSFIFTACATHSNIAPSQNSTLQAISPANDNVQEGGYMQRALDTWLKTEWLPLTDDSTEKASQSVSTTTSSVTDDETFSLQHYMDKWKKYHDGKTEQEKREGKKPSHQELMGTLPVISK